MTTTYRIRNASGLPWDGDTYETQAAAAEALASHMGWDITEMAEAEYSNGNTEAWECYETQEACDACPDGDPYAPRIEEIDSEVRA